MLTLKATAWTQGASTYRESHEPLRLPHLFLNFEHRINTQLQETTELAGDYDRLKSTLRLKKAGNHIKVESEGRPPMMWSEFSKPYFPVILGSL